MKGGHRLTAFMVMLACGSLQAATWAFAQRKDVITQVLVSTASVTDSQGRTLSVFNGPTGSAWISFGLGKGQRFDLSQPPLYRLGSMPPVDLADELRFQAFAKQTNLEWAARGFGAAPSTPEPRIEYKPTVVRFRFNKTKEEGFESDGPPRALLEEAELAIQYTTEDGNSHDVVFPLAGSAPLIQRIFGPEPQPN